MILLVIVWMVVNICETIAAALVLSFLIILVSLDWSWIRVELERQNATMTAELDQSLGYVEKLIFTIGLILLIAVLVYVIAKIYFLIVVWSARHEVYRRVQIENGTVVRADSSGHRHHHKKHSGGIELVKDVPSTSPITGRSSVTTIQMAPLS